MVDPFCSLSFGFGLFPHNALYQLDVDYAYELVTLLIFNRYSTIGCTPNNPHLEQSFTELKPGFYHLPRSGVSPNLFIQLSSTQLSLNPALIPLVRKPYKPFPTHISMILFTLNLSLHDFVFEFPISSRCGALGTHPRPAMIQPTFPFP